ncbi:L-rhamnose mutarotase [Sphingobium sp.]|uniref:L-rhamnose mutarotase n=1 Tax=Sphingobium sp. TaxID=1912891 RepID=UPI002BCE258C|nr:L-rhamnose mutarotase [Sphingobium sp.]HUD93040.1 L-rhamnose mutarotase [Sphingobium sp.]
MRHILLIDLADDAQAIAQYEEWHASGALPPAIGTSIRAADVTAMEIYRSGNRLVMLMETGPGFDPAAKAAADAANPAMQIWEAQMDGVQRPLSWAVPDAKWTEATRIFSLDEQP